MRVTLNQAKLLYVSSLPSHPQAEGHNDLAAVNTSDSSDFGHLGRTSQATKKMTGRTSQHVSQLAFAGGGNILGDCSSCAHFALSLYIRISNSPILKSQQHDCYAAYTLHIHCIYIAYALHMLFLPNKLQSSAHATTYPVMPWPSSVVLCLLTTQTKVL